QLIAQRLARTGRHDRERVDAGEHVANRERLAGTERADPEPALAELEHVRIDRCVVAAEIDGLVLELLIVIRIDNDRIDVVGLAVRGDPRQRIARAARKLGNALVTEALIAKGFRHQTLPSPTRANHASKTWTVSRKNHDVRRRAPRSSRSY